MKSKDTILLENSALNYIKPDGRKVIHEAMQEYADQQLAEYKAKVEELWPEVCRRYAEEVNKVDEENEPDFHKLFNEWQKKRGVNYGGHQDEIWHESQASYIAGSLDSWNRCVNEISQLKKQLEDKQLSIDGFKSSFEKANEELQLCRESNESLKSKLEVKEKPDFEIHNVIMQRWEKDFKSIHSEQMMDAYMVSGFIRNIISSELLRDAAIAERDKELIEADRQLTIKKQQLAERDEKIKELEKIIEGKNLALIELSSAMDKLRKSRIASCKASLDKASKNGRVKAEHVPGSNIYLRTVDESSINSESNIVIVE